MESQIDLIAPEAKFVSLVKRGGETIEVNSDSFKDIDANLYYKQEDSVYMFEVEGEILKIGQTERTVAKRIESYNSNRRNNKTEGRLMSEIMGLKKKVRLYIIPATGTLSINGKEYPVKSKTLERIYLDEYVRIFGRLPILNKAFY
jgi:hypothetical protein